MKCDQGHQLLKSVVDADRIPICDGCNTEMEVGNDLFSCFMCDFDVCQSCEGKSSSGVSSGSSVKKSHFAKSRDLQSSSTLTIALVGFTDAHPPDAVSLVREHVHDYMPEFMIEITGFYKAAVSMRVAQSEAEAIKAKFAENRDVFMWLGKHLTLVEVKAGDIKKYILPKASSASTSAPAPPASGVLGSPAAQSALRALLPAPASSSFQVPDLPKYADREVGTKVVMETEDDTKAMFEFIRQNMATKHDIVELQNSIEKRTKEYVDTGIAFVSTELSKTNAAVVEVNTRVDGLAQAMHELKVEGVKTEDKANEDDTQIIAMLDAADQAFQRISFLGFQKQKDTASLRNDKIRGFMQEHFSDVTYASIGHPKDKSSLKTHSFVQFFSREDRDEVLKTIKDSQLKATNGAGTNLHIDRARLKSQSRRYAFLMKAKDLITTKYEGQGKSIEVTTELPVRTVKVNGVTMFTQKYKSQIQGTFLGECSGLHF